MDSEERHDLKTNDLQDFFEHFGDFWSKWGNTLLTAVAVVVIVFAGSRIYSDWTAQAREAAWADLSGATSPQAADMVATDHSGHAMVRTLATLKAADFYLFEASLPAPAENRAAPVDGGADPVETERQALLDKAEARYKTVLKMDAPTIVRINAELGLASVAEGRQQWDQAGTHYDNAMKLAGDRYLTLKTLTQAKLDRLPQLSQNVVFGPSVDATAEGLGPVQPDSPAGDQPSIGPITTPGLDDMFGGNPADALDTIADPDADSDASDSDGNEETPGQP